MMRACLAAVTGVGEATKVALPRRVPFLVCLVLLGLLAFCGAQSASAQAPPPPLTGEVLFAGDHNPEVSDVTVTGDCNEDGTGTVTFEASGPASAPYPGTFTASGTGVVGPIEGFFHTMLSFTETFTIDSPVGQVEGEKTLLVPLPYPGAAQGFCGSVFDDVTAFQLFGPVSYEATITAPDGSTYTDRGTGRVGVTGQQGPGSFTFQTFEQVFESDLGVLCAGRTKDKPGTEKDKCKKAK